MDFKVNPLQRPVIVNPYQNVARSAAAGKKTTQAGDQVDVSGSAALFKSMLQNMQNAPEVRMDKVNAVKTQIENGEYSINSRAIAEKMLGHIIG
jgi:negative regulator of flagellin synthesis FlgM